MSRQPGNDAVRSLWRYVTESKLQLMRNVSLGGAGASLAIILLLCQIGISDDALYLSAVSVAFGLPCWMAIAQMYEQYIFYGRRSYKHIRSDKSINMVGALVVFATLSLGASIAGLLWHLKPFALLAFCVGLAFAIVVVALHDYDLKAYVVEKDRGDDDKSQ